MKKIYTCLKNDNFNYKKLNSKFYSFIYSISSHDDVKKHLNDLKIKGLSQSKKFSDTNYRRRLEQGYNKLF